MVRVRAYAKVNLGLRVTGLRPDGYHELDTVFQTVSLYDALMFVPRPDGRIVIECAHPDVPEDESNLCYRAARALRPAAKAAAGITISIVKRIPVGGGMGGGSSDAAAVLTVLRSLWHCRITDERLHGLAAGLGADVPFFLYGGTARARGIGDLLEFIDYDAPQWVVIIIPGISVSTAWAYKNLKLDLTTRPDNIYSYGLQKTDVIGLAEVMGNDFEQGVFEKHPEIAAYKALLVRHGARPALMSGSGAAVFGVFAHEREARSAAADAGNAATVERFVPRSGITDMYGRALARAGTSGPGGKR